MPSSAPRRSGRHRVQDILCLQVGPDWMTCFQVCTASPQGHESFLEGRGSTRPGIC